MLCCTILRGVAGAPLALALVLACSAPEELPLLPVVWEGESIRVRMDDPGIAVCGGTFEALDRHAALVREALLLEGDGIIEYTITDEELVDEACNPGSPAACAKPLSGDVFTSIPMHEHEIVHAVRILDPEIELRSPPIEEGLATLMGGDRLDDIDPGFDPAILLDEGRVQGALEYHHAGQMMAILLGQHGAESLRRFDTLANNMDEDSAFVEAFGESKEQFVEDLRTAPHCEQSQWWIPLLECDGVPVTADPSTSRLVLSGNVECGEVDVLGPRSGRMWTSRHFQLDELTSVPSYEFDLPEDATLEIVSCNGGCPDRFAYLGTRSEVGSILSGLPALEPGEYVLRVSRPVAEGDGYFEVTLH